MKKLIVLVMMSLGLFSGVVAAETKYPIVLIHGLLGFGEGMSWIARYFGDIPDALRASGATVYVADVSQANTVDTRGEQLAEQLSAWGHERYNLIGHSHGGLDARYVLENYPELVASVTTISSPHRGSRVADAVYETTAHDDLSRWLFSELGEMLGHLLATLSGTLNSQDFYEAIRGLTTESLREFNYAHRIGLGANSCDDGPREYRGRKLYSWGSVMTDRVDGMNGMFNLTSHAFAIDEDNDGLVSVCSMKFGTWLGTMRGHHLVPVLGIVFPITDHQRNHATELFLQHAQRLALDGV